MCQLPIYFCSFPFSFLLCRFLPYLIPASEEDGESGPDLSTLRTFRVLRPLKLVSGVPSKHYFGLGPIPRPKSSLKIRTASAICWNYLGLFRDYGLEYIFLGIKLFWFSRQKAENFSICLEKYFLKSHKILTQSDNG